MKILQVGKFYYPNRGGIETFLKTLTEGLTQAGDQVTVLCSSDKTSFKATDEEINGVRVIRVPFLGSAFSQPVSPTLPGWLLRLAREHDVVHVHTPNPLAELASLALPSGKSGPLPLVVSYHSDVIRQKLLMPAYAPVLRSFLARANRIAVATPSHVQHSEPLSRPAIAAKCQVIPYGLDPSRFTRTPELATRAADLRERFGRYILFVGRLVGYKGVEFLIEASRAFEATVVIAGDGPLRAELERRASGLEVQFLGTVDDETLAACFLGSDLLVLPSVTRAEAFGLAQLEAMAWGIPTVSTRLDSGASTVSVHDVTGLQVPPGDSDALGAAINSLLGNDDRRARMGRAAKERFLLEFTRDKMIRSYRALYASIRS